MAQTIAILVIALPALAVVLWPLLRGRSTAGPETAGSPEREGQRELAEERDSIFRALRELDFEHEAGLLADDDHAEMRGRYEARAAEALRALDALGPIPAPARPAAAARTAAPDAGPAPRRGLARNPAVLAVGALLVLAFGVVLGLNIGRFTEPDLSAATAGAVGPAPAPMAGGGAPGGGSDKALAPEMLAGMLSAARQSLAAGRYQEAIAAYQAILKRDVNNVDAMTHLGLIVAIGGHADAALETWGKALQIDPDYAPAYLYRGELLYEVKKDYPAAIESWKRFVALVPKGEDHDRVQDLIRQAQTKPPAAR